MAPMAWWSYCAVNISRITRNVLRMALPVALAGLHGLQYMLLSLNVAACICRISFNRSNLFLAAAS